MLQVFGWLSGLIVAFLGAYITGVLTLLVPPPQNFLCSLGLGYCPDAEIVEFLATDPDRISESEGVGQAPSESQIGMLHNSVDQSPECKPNSVEYFFDVSSAGQYSLRVLYAAFDSRPVEILVYNELVAGNALDRITGGWRNQHREWSSPISVQLSSGTNSLLIRSQSCFPHLSRFEIREA